MSTDGFRRIERLFEQALALPPADRVAFLDRACGEDAALRREVESLLEADGRAGAFMDPPASPTVGRGAVMRDRVGAYQLLRRVGEGGMSEVYLAVRADDEYRKSVALKVIRHDLDREDVIRRFRTERQILAGLDHPNIARMLDGGTTEDGLPYFAMDYIEGVPIDRYCDQSRLTVRERLLLFRTVCSAVQYAHQNLVVHRDIKPSNILVSADGVPRLLDFGIAKLLKPDQFAHQVERTATWMRPMTPLYASPEQVQGKAVTTSSDVYSLGVLLYSLLCDRLPHDSRGKTPTEFARAVVEDEPRRPSEAVDRPPAGGEEDAPDANAEPGDAFRSAAAVAVARGAGPQQLRRQLSGDLDNIVLMALRKEPQRRYASVEQLSEDVRRYLDGLPVIARKDTLGYRARKFLRRNWPAVAASAAFVAVLAGFAATMAVQAARVAHERDQARRERDRARRVVEFMEEIFAVSDPLQGVGRDLPASEILDRGARRVTAEMADEPEVQATLLAAIGNVYRNLGLFDRARPLLQQALEVRRRIYGARHVAVAESLHDLGVVERDLGDYASARSRLTEALELRRELLPNDSRELAETLNFLGSVLRQRGEYQDAETTFRESISIQERASARSPELATAKNNLAALALEMGRLPEAEALFRESLALREALLGRQHPLYAQNLSNLGATLGMQGKYREAEPYLREALAIMREVLAAEHPALVETLNNLAKLNLRMGNLDAAEPLYREALAIELKRVGERHPSVAHIASNLAELLQAKGDWTAAEGLYRQALEIRRAALGHWHADTGGSAIRLGAMLVALGRPREAEPLLREGSEILAQALPPDHWRHAEARSLTGECSAALGRFDEAERLLVSGYEGLRDTRGPEHELTRAAAERLSRFYTVRGRPDEAARVSGRPQAQPAAPAFAPKTP